MSVKMAGQTISDRLLAAKHSIAGQGLAKSVCKATTEELIGPKKKHLDYLIHCTNEPNVSIPQLANLLIERSQNTNWIVVYKSLITVHHMLCYGNERFTQYLASSNSTFQLSNFLDKSGVQGARVGYDMSPFIRRYAKYLNEKALSYRTVAFDFCKVKRGKEDGTLRTMNAEHLLKTLPVLQAQLDSLLEFDCTSNDLTNGVINMAFMLLFRDLIRLFACYNDGIINLLEKYFEMNKKQCRDALDLYKKFLIRMDRVGEFLKVAENVGIDKGDIPDLTKAPSSLLDALEQHLAAIEGKKGSAANTPTQTASNRTNVKSGVNALSSTSTAFGTAATNARLEAHANGIDESLKQHVLAEEEAALNQYKAKVSSPTNNGTSTNPFLSSPTISSSQPIVDLFGSPTVVDNNSQAVRASDDLLQLSGNPFADMFGNTAAPETAITSTTNNNDMWMSNGFRPAGQPNAGTNAFVSDQGFASVFGGNDTAAEPGHSYFFSPRSDALTFSMQAAGTDLPNPFTSGFPPGQHALPPNPAGGQTGGDNLFEGGDLFGDKIEVDIGKQFAGGVMASPPPPRPPPPSAIGGTPQSVSPIPNTASPSRPAAVANKSAFDDLNDSIRMALGGSPSKQASLEGGGGAQGQMAPGGGGMAFAGITPIGYGSPAKPGIGMTGFDAMGDVLQPLHHAGGMPGISAGGMAPMGGQATSDRGKVLTGDLDSSLASLAQNLSINKGGQPVTGVQWNSPKNAAKPGGATGWSPQPMAATTGANYRPMGQGMASMNVTVQAFPMMQQPMGMQGMQAGMRPMGTTPPAAAPGMMSGGGGVMGSPRIGGGGPPNQQAAQPQQLDPFGAL